MRILVTNDDGINAPGIRKLVEIAVRFGEVTIIAPDGQRSAASHQSTFGTPLIMNEVDYSMDNVKAYSLNGTPADCVRVGILGVMDPAPDLVLSGINNGYNMASDIQYSGTVGAALEAAFYGIQAIAVSIGINGSTDIIDRYLPDLLEEYISKPLGKDQVWNINFPECSIEECRGILHDLKVSKDDFYEDDISIDKNDDGSFVITEYAKRRWEASEGTDLHAIINNYIAVGPVNNIS